MNMSQALYGFIGLFFFAMGAFFAFVVVLALFDIDDESFTWVGFLSFKKVKKIDSDLVEIKKEIEEINVNI